MRSRFIAIGAAAVLASGAVAVVVFTWNGTNAEPSPGRSRLPPATAEVRRGPIVETRTVTGTLGFGDLSSVRPRLKSGTGMVTWLASEDTTVARGEPLFAIDGQPAIVFYGDFPQYRTLRFTAESIEWVELETARDTVRAGTLKLAAEKARCADAEARLATARARLTDSHADEPATPEFADLAGAVRSAEERLERVQRLAAANVAPSTEVTAAERELTAARAAIEAATRNAREQVSAAKIDLAAAEEAIAAAERALVDLDDRLATLEAQASGASDVEQIQANLAALGYAGTLASMVRTWQADAGLPATGIIEPAHIFVVPEAVKVAEHVASVGETVSDTSSERLTVLDYTGTQRSVTVPLTVADRPLATEGGAVVVTLPDGTEVDGAVATVGSVVTDGEIEVTIDIPDQQALGTLDIAAVDVEFVSDRRDDVLFVPVTALLAQSGGGFVVELIEGQTSRLVPVETGLFAEGRVEVSGQGIAEGTLVGVPG
ncbi:hypothetical protein [Devosia nitrariae]|uniref:HlyD family efflux transporter periplasmic adaptor subunit n=1 Tax=Devosia nitrariae TaxID=2071872 RepID=A0ABQ5W4G8_9HYPH|nr:hypothetical protein [Devosia nitrariae]GLQ54954.1 hypothetical protein GCM10010862_22130 [Devosia nitrariae]